MDTCIHGDSVSAGSAVLQTASYILWCLIISVMLQILCDVSDQKLLEKNHILCRSLTML